MSDTTPKWRQWVSEKLNPAQPSMASSNGISRPEVVVEFEKAYSDIEIVHRAVEIIINACVEVPILVEGDGPSKKVNKLLNHYPNPFEDRSRLFRRAFLDFFIDGNAFFYYDGTYLYVLPANDVEVVPDPKTFVSHYIYNAGGSSSLFGSKEKNTIRFSSSEIIHIMSENTSSVFRGTSKLKPILRLLELYYYMIDFQKQFFRNNALPGLVLVSDNVLSVKVKQRILETWRNTYATIYDGTRSPAILDGGLKIDKFSTLNFTELDFESSIERIQQDMAKALGVPYVLLKSGNNANIDANQKLFYQHTILPIMTMFCAAFANFFNGLEIRPDKLSINALRPDAGMQAKYYSTLVNAGIITPNEAREGLRFKQLENMDSIRIPQNITGSATNPASGGRPEGEQDDE